MSKKPKENRLVVADAGWADTIPEWLLEEVKTERLTLGLGSIVNPDIPKVGDAEVCVYLYTAGLRGPLSAEHTQIYINLAGRLARRHWKKVNTEEGDEVSCVKEEINERDLTRYEERVLEDLRSMLYRKRGGEISHPLLDAMRMFKAVVEKESKQPQLSLF